LDVGLQEFPRNFIQVAMGKMDVLMKQGEETDPLRWILLVTSNCMRCWNYTKCGMVLWFLHLRRKHREMTDSSSWQSGTGGETHVILPPHKDCQSEVLKFAWW
jgi:hypothetical protein